MGLSHGWVIQNADGLSGGIAISWDKSLFQYKGHAQSKCWIWVQFSNIASGKSFHVINVYAPQKPRLKMELWGQLSDIVDLTFNQPACFAGDFNCIRRSDECANCIYRVKDSLTFNAFIKKGNLFDTKLTNCLYTWFGTQKKKS